MDIAVVVSGHRHGSATTELMTRPFADTTLIELALEKLAHLDAPCGKYVACPDREIKGLAEGYDGLQTIRASHLLRWQDISDSSTAFTHLRNLSQSSILVINPAYPFVSSDLWWQVVEDSLVSGAIGITSAESENGPFYSRDGTQVAGVDQLFVRNDAFVMIPRVWAEPQTHDLEKSFSPYILDRDSSRGVKDPIDLSAFEAIWSRSQLRPTHS